MRRADYQCMVCGARQEIWSIGDLTAETRARCEQGCGGKATPHQRLWSTPNIGKGSSGGTPAR